MPTETQGVVCPVTGAAGGCGLLMWVLGNELRSSGRAICELNNRLGSSPDHTSSLHDGIIVPDVYTPHFCARFQLVETWLSLSLDCCEQNFCKLGNAAVSMIYWFHFPL